jgi:hypothetical protein
MGSVHNSAVANVGGFFKHYIEARKNVNDAIFLHVGAVAHGDSAPVSAKYRARTDVYVAANPHVARHIRLRVNKGGGVNNGAHAIKRVKHLVNL